MKLCLRIKFSGGRQFCVRNRQLVACKTSAADSIFINLSVAPFYVVPPDKAAAIKMLLYLLTAGWCKVGYSTPMNVNVSKTPPFTNPPNVIGYAMKLTITFILSLFLLSSHSQKRIVKKRTETSLFLVPRLFMMVTIYQVTKISNYIKYDQNGNEIENGTYGESKQKYSLSRMVSL